jgi:outer membrane receptor protein involved in Fe transport
MITQPTPVAFQARTQRLAGVARATLLTAFGTGIISTASYAQNQSNTESNNTRRALEEIIVTATKRAESIQDVPISMAAIGADEIERRGLVSAEDYLRGIPGVNQTSDQVGSSIIIRGVETSPSYQNYSSGTTVATYFGETPITNSAGLAANSNVDIKLVDIERVEVLRGPQGTAFGNSSLGGAVRTIPVAPKLGILEGKVGVGYSSTSGYGSDNTMVQGVINAPLIKDKLAIRATAYQFEDSGFYRNNGSTDPVLQAAAAEYGAQAYANDQRDVGASTFTGGRIAALFQPTDELKLTLTYLTQKTEVDGAAFANSGVYDQAMFQLSPEHNIRGQRGSASDTDVDIGNVTLEYDFGWASLVATYSHIESGALNANSYSESSPIWPLSYIQDGEHKEKSGEVRLTSQLDGAWNFLVGVYAEDLDDDAFYDYRWQGTDLDANPFGDSFVGDYRDVRNLKQTAAFTEVSWEFLPKLTLTGGARFYDFKRRSQADTSGPLFGLESTAIRADASGDTFRANLSYKPNDDGLLYASWSQGFRLGKPQPGLPASLCDVNNDGLIDGASNVTLASTTMLESDNVDNYEIGTKFNLFDNRLIISADIYRIDWKGVPFRVAAPAQPDGCGLTYNANAGGARSEGVEFQANLHVTPALRVDFGASTIDASLTKDAPVLDAFEGDRLPGSPKVNANLAVQYEFDVVGYEAFVRADSIYVGRFFGDLQESPITEAGDYVKIDLSARVAINDFNVDLFVRNLTDRDDYSFRGTFDSGRSLYGYRLRPRTVGLQLGYNF